MTALWMVWDGASYDVVAGLLDRGALPALASVVAAGGAGPLTPPFPNCQTPPGLASLFTGAPAHRHGVTGFDLPVAGGRIDETRSAFAPDALRVPPMWDDLAAAGGRAALVHVPWADAGRARAAFAVDAYPRRVFGPDVVDLVRPPSGRWVEIEIGGAPVRVRVDADLLEVTIPDGHRAVVPVRSKTRLVPLDLGDGVATHIAAFAGGGRLHIAHTGAWRTSVTPAVDAAALDRLAGPFAGLSWGTAYRDGRLGLRAPDGGRGGAEAILLASLRAVAATFERASAFATSRITDADLLVAYQPVIDDAQHSLFRWADDGGPCAHAVDAAYRLADRHLGLLLAALPPDTPVVVASDHGVAAVDRMHYVNVTLARAGLLRFGRDGAIDARQTSAAYHPARNGSVWVNTTDRPDGVVEPSDVPAVLARAEAVLRGVRDPDGRRPIAAVYPRDVPAGAAWDPGYGDLFLVGARGYELRAEHADGETAATAKGGTHVTSGAGSTLAGLVAARGPGIHGTPSAHGNADVRALVESLMPARVAP